MARSEPSAIRGRYSPFCAVGRGLGRLAVGLGAVAVSTSSIGRRERLLRDSDDVGQAIGVDISKRDAAVAVGEDLVGAVGCIGLIQGVVDRRAVAGDDAQRAVHLLRVVAAVVADDHDVRRVVARDLTVTVVICELAHHGRHHDLGVLGVLAEFGHRPLHHGVERAGGDLVNAVLIVGHGGRQRLGDVRALIGRDRGARVDVWIGVGVPIDLDGILDPAHAVLLAAAQGGRAQK